MARGYPGEFVRKIENEVNYDNRDQIMNKTVEKTIETGEERVLNFTATYPFLPSETIFESGKEVCSAMPRTRCGQTVANNIFRRLWSY